VSDKISQLHAALQAGDMRALARGITLVESSLADGVSIAASVAQNCLTKL
jgi:putative protein kinase ArgK-like GTPase of G3E family